MQAGVYARNCTEIFSKQIFQEMKQRGLVPNFYIYVSVSEIIQAHDRSVYFAVVGICMNVSRNWERGRTVSFLGIFVSIFGAIFTHRTASPILSTRQRLSRIRIRMAGT
jgi:hypothetical protein